MNENPVQVLQSLLRDSRVVSNKQQVVYYIKEADSMELSQAVQSDDYILEKGSFYVIDKGRGGKEMCLGDGVSTYVNSFKVKSSQGTGSSIEIDEVVGLRTELNNKVDKDGDKVLSDNNFTDDEKEKLSNLETPSFRGRFPNEAELISGVSIPRSGDFAYVEGTDETGAIVITYQWVVANSAWEPAHGVSNAETSLTIKQKYEANPDTNNFSDEYKSYIDKRKATTFYVEADLSTEGSSVELKFSNFGYKLTYRDERNLTAWIRTLEGTEIIDFRLAESYDGLIGHDYNDTWSLSTAGWSVRGVVTISRSFGLAFLRENGNLWEIRYFASGGGKRTSLWASLVNP